MINKLAEALHMSFKIPDSERIIAQNAVNDFTRAINSISIAKDHLDILYSPFKEAQEISTELLIKYRGKFNRFRGQAKRNFSNINSQIFAGLKKLNYFSTDTHCSELLSALTEQESDTKSACKKLLESLDDYKSSDFKDKIILAIDNVKKELSQLESLVKERIIDHLETNIIGKMGESKEEGLHLLEEKVPTVLNIYNKINNPKQEFPQIQKRQQIFNPSDAQRVFYPQDLREVSKMNI